MTKLLYRIFKTTKGFFGVLSGPNGLVATCAFCPDPATARQNLLQSAQIDLKDPNLTIRERKTLNPELVNRIKQYLSGQKVDFSDIHADLTEYKGIKAKVLQTLKNVKYGNTISYGEIARKCRHPRAARAVGNIMAQNPLPIVIPCHRVIKSDGSTGNYMKNNTNGPKIKKHLLEMERKAKQT